LDEAQETFISRRDRREIAAEHAETIGYISFTPTMSGLWMKPNRLFFHAEIAEELPQRTRRLWVYIFYAYYERALDEAQETFISRRDRREIAAEHAETIGYISFTPTISGLWMKPNRLFFRAEIAEELPQRTRRLWVYLF